MSGIVIELDPVLLRLGILEVEWHGLLTAVAAIVGVLLAVHAARSRGIPSSTIYTGAFLVLASGLVGARLFHVVDHFDYYSSNPAEIFRLQGLAIWGGLAGGGVAALTYARVKRIPLGFAADALVPAVLVGQMIGRIGCVLNGDAYGGATDLPWGFTYAHPAAAVPNSLFGISTHPYPVYEIIWNALALLLLLRLRRHFRTDGLLFLTYLAIYSVGRIVLSTVRQEKIWFWGLQEAQVLGIVVLVVAAVMAVYLTRRSRGATAEIAVPVHQSQ
jgi:phosphatidylglycerol:prolipoprotein diacylglycerol transferase